MGTHHNLNNSTDTDSKNELATTTDFARIGRLLTDTAAGDQVEAPGFRSPPRIPGVRRSVTRNRDGSVTVAVVVRDRPVMAVLSDMIDGVVLTSGRQGADARHLYDRLWRVGQDWLTSEQAPRPHHLRVAA